jgi:antitoxin VapB
MVDFMALNIKDPDTDRLARELAEATGESITVAARRAIEERLQRVRAQAAAGARANDLEAIIARGRRRRVFDERTADEILGYDGSGLPR